MTNSQYSYDDDLKRFKKEEKQRRKMEQKREAQQYEPRRYTSRDESFARRFNAGARLMGGDN